MWNVRIIGIFAKQISWGDGFQVGSFNSTISRVQSIYLSNLTFFNLPRPAATATAATAATATA